MQERHNRKQRGNGEIQIIQGRGVTLVDLLIGKVTLVTLRIKSK